MNATDKAAYAVELWDSLPKHHPECGPGFPEPGCHRQCPTVLKANAVLRTHRARRSEGNRK